MDDKYAWDYVKLDSLAMRSSAKAYIIHGNAYKRTFPKLQHQLPGVPLRATRRQQPNETSAM